MNENCGMKSDAGKVQYHLLDRVALEEMARVRMFGANKYSKWDWRKGFTYSRLIDATMRHMWAFQDGEDNDPESGLSHVAHAAVTLMFLLRLIKDMPEKDDRYQSQRTPEPTTIEAYAAHLASKGMKIKSLNIKKEERNDADNF